ncbi:MAG: MarR family transcriptional regulator [Clostridia bacterium]|jgi:DNA-binding MarR family transcriptional regulator|nr:MarR family transcriptional regulator [Clostridia bacterium]
MQDNLAQRLSEGISAFYRANMNQRNNFPIRSSEMGSLIYIYLNAGTEGVRAVELSEYFGIRKSSVSTIVDSLEKNGYISKSKSEIDKRNNPIFVTDKGAELVKEAFEEYYSASNKMIDRIGVEKCEEFLQTLNLVIKIIQKEDDSI